MKTAKKRKNHRNHEKDSKKGQNKGCIFTILTLVF